jgi:phytoene synthase
MEPLEYCRNKAAPPGSSLHYALLFASNDAAPGLLAVNALHAEISTIADDCSEPGVAAVKLNWWAEELERLRGGQPRHPVSQAMAEAISTHELDPHALDELVSGARMDLEYGTYPSFRELTVYCHRLGVTPAQLAVQICGHDTPGSLAVAHDLGMGLQLVRMLRRLPRHLASGRVYFPEDELEEAGVDRERLVAGHTDETLMPVLAQHASRARAFLDSADERVAGTDRERLQPLLVTAALYRRLLDTIEADGFPLLQRHHHLTPIRKLGLAWRTARRQRRLGRRAQKAAS